MEFSYEFLNKYAFKYLYINSYTVWNNGIEENNDSQVFVWCEMAMWFDTLSYHGKSVGCTLKITFQDWLSVFIKERMLNN